MSDVGIWSESNELVSVSGSCTWEYLDPTPEMAELLNSSTSRALRSVALVSRRQTQNSCVF
jgi:hypothetical protein